jgi:hypothetical protein
MQQELVGLELDLHHLRLFFTMHHSRLRPTRSPDLATTSQAGVMAQTHLPSTRDIQLAAA